MREERSAGGVVVREIEDVCHVLVIRDPYGQWGLPKGHLEDDEDLSDAALREVREETGLHDAELGPELGTVDWYFRLKGELVHKFCTFFLMRSDEAEAVPEAEEGITECRWIPLDRAAESVDYDNTREVVRKAVGMLRPPRSSEAEVLFEGS